MTVARRASSVAVVVGWPSSAGRCCGPCWPSPLFQRENFRGRRLPVRRRAGRSSWPCWRPPPCSPWSCCGPTTAGRSAARSRRRVIAGRRASGCSGSSTTWPAPAAAVASGATSARWRQGELTTGLLKLVGGGLVAVVVALAVGRGLAAPTCVAAALVVALAANLGNLLDRAPGPRRQGQPRRLRRAGRGVAPGAGAGRTGAGGRRRRRDAVARPAGALHARRHRRQRARRGRRPRPRGHHRPRRVVGRPSVVLAALNLRQRAGQLQPGDRPHAARCAGSTASAPARR